MRAFLRRLWRALTDLAAGWRRLDARTVDRGLRVLVRYP